MAILYPSGRFVLHTPVRLLPCPLLVPFSARLSPNRSALLRLSAPTPPKYYLDLSVRLSTNQLETKERLSSDLIIYELSSSPDLPFLLSPRPAIH
ncbi:unnamed protein product [Protopolystoma xenopodis]|uniref:Uncharacterized protein n=1 Tax=Protopolystoma xenopodis TaxID=117903 RepID=A0A3S5B3U3_9PLAT|nr:unnamed protein product [Protopolystoma xenopodis]